MTRDEKIDQILEQISEINARLAVLEVDLTSRMKVRDGAMGLLWAVVGAFIVYQLGIK